MVCLIFGQISKNPGNQSWLAVGTRFFQQSYPPFRWIILKNCTVPLAYDDLLTQRRTGTVLEEGSTNPAGINQMSSIYLFGGIRLICPLGILSAHSDALDPYLCNSQCRRCGGRGPPSFR